MKTSWQLEEEERERDRKSLKFGGGLDVLNQALQGIPGGLEGAIQWMNKGRDWQPDPENFNKLVNKNPVLKKAWKEFDTESRQWTGKQLGKIQESRKALDKWTYSNLDRATGAIGEYNPAGKLSDAFTDIGNMVTGKYGATGPAKNIRDAIKQTRLDDPGQDPDLVRLTGKELTRHLKKFETPNDRKAELLNTVNSDNRAKEVQSTSISSNFLGGSLPDTKAMVEKANKVKAANKAAFEKEAMDKWINKTRNSPAQRSGAFEKEELWDLHKKANPKWDEAYTPKSEVKSTTQTKIQKKAKTDEITKNVKDKKDATDKTSLENIGSSLLNQTKAGQAYKNIKNVVDIAKSIKAVGAAKTASTMVAGIDPVTIALSIAVNAAKQNAQGSGASSGTGYREIDKGQEYDEWNYLA